MRAIGLDIGGTKIETQVFSEDWELKGRTRVPTPLEYPDFLETVRRQIFAAREDEMQVAIGIGAAGVVHPKTGRVVAANPRGGRASGARGSGTDPGPAHFLFERL